MPKNPNAGHLFTIYEELPIFTSFLYSMWEVDRTDAYVTDSERRNEPQFLYAFVRTTKGEGIIETKNSIHVLYENSVALFDVNAIKKYYPAGESWSYTWYNFSPKSEIPFFKFNKPYNLPPTQREKELNLEMRKLMQSYSQINIQLTTTLFSEQVYRFVKTIQEGQKEESPHYSTIYDVITYINENIKEHFKMSELASKCFLSERQFRYVFKKIMGLPPKTYICQQKLKKAAVILKTSSLPVSTIAYELNYTSPYQFSKDFKAFYDLSPKQYRNSSGEKKRR